MAVPMMALVKLKLLLACGHSNWQLLAGLLLPYVLKLPLATRMPGSFADLALLLRLTLFRLNRILFQDSPARTGRRWERALRLIHARVVEDNRFTFLQDNIETLNTVSELAL